MTDQEWLDRRAKEIDPCEIAEKKRKLRESFIANAKYRWVRGKTKWICSEYYIIPQIGLSVDRKPNYNASLYEMYGLSEFSIGFSFCFLRFKQEWSFTYSKMHPEMNNSIGDGGAL
jgi:hypothetical protein